MSKSISNKSSPSQLNPKEDMNWWRYFPELNPNPVFEVNIQDHELTYSNSAAQSLQTSITPEEWFETISTFIKIHQNSINNFEVQQSVLRLHGKYYDTKLKYFDEYNTIRVFLTDQTPIQQAKEEMRLAKIMAERLVETKSVFLANMSHEIRTPINGVVGATQLLLDGSPTEDQRELLNIISSSVGSLGNIINNILDLSKLENQKVLIESVPFDISTLVSELTSLTTIEARTKEISIHSRLPDDVLPLFMGDPTRLRQILTNLLNNAIKFTHEGTVELAVDYVSKVTGTHALTFSVSDTGIGIAEDKIDHIFESFYQAEISTTRKYGGSGLGMAISQELAGLMGANISVESELGRGSVFSFTIELEPAIEKVVAGLPDGNGLERNYKKKILIAEDVQVNAILLSKLLGNLGLEADVAANGQEALDLFNSSYDLVLMDMQMPVLDGLDATRALIKDGCDVPIIAVTANASEADLQKCTAAGMEGYLTKPLYKTKLIEELDRHIGS
jgi:signal transduction histidine kinase